MENNATSAPLHSLVGRPVPDCCSFCIHIDSDCNEFTGSVFYYCLMNTFLPWNKGTCKRQRKPNSGKHGAPDLQK
jgi:hypothetical protein